MELWEQTAEQIERYLKVVESSIELVSEEIKIKDAEITIVYWVF